MLTDASAFSSFAVDDLATARGFYADTLGLRTETVDGMPLLELHPAGTGRTMVYEKPDFVPATYTVLNFAVADIHDGDRIERERRYVTRLHGPAPHATRGVALAARSRTR